MWENLDNMVDILKGDVYFLCVVESKLVFLYVSVGFMGKYLWLVYIRIKKIILYVYICIVWYFFVVVYYLKVK